MLARWPIRIKLMLALAILTAIVTTLASSGFWGLYRYRRVANSVGQRATELPIVISITRNAKVLQDCQNRIRKAKENESVYGLGKLVLTIDNPQFSNTLLAFEGDLEHYKSTIETTKDHNEILLDLSDRQEIVNNLEQQLKQVQKITHSGITALPLRDLDALHEQLDSLYSATEQLQSSLQNRMASFRAEVRGQYRAWIGLAWSCAILSAAMIGLLLWLFRSLVVLPFRTLLSGCRLVASGQFGHRIDLGTGDELSELADAMNHMTDRFQDTYGELEQLCESLDQQVHERTCEVIQREQLASVGFLAAGVAHEINNPMATIAWSAEALESRLHDVIHASGQRRPLSENESESLRTNLRRIQDEAFRCKGITERLLDFSRLGNVKLTVTDISLLIEDVVAMVSTLGQYRCKQVQVDCPPKITASVNAQEIRQVILNLVTNALECVDADGTVTVKARSNGERVKIIVEDNGCGMTEEVREHLFEPFFTRRRSGKGTGLGLSITFQIVSRHNGQITAHSEGPGTGSRLCVTLPLESVEAKHESLAVA